MYISIYVLQSVPGHAVASATTTTIAATMSCMTTASTITTSTAAVNRTVALVTTTATPLVSQITTCKKATIYV